MSRTECLREVAPARTMPRAPLVLARKIDDGGGRRKESFGLETAKRVYHCCVDGGRVAGVLVCASAGHGY